MDSLATPMHSNHNLELAFAEQLQQLGFSGDIQLDDASRTVYSTDNSIYQVFPAGVLCPRTNQDVVTIARLAQQQKFQTIVFCARGGGTGTNGQALSSGFIVDFSKYMNQILEINVEQRWARVQAGVVKDQLNAEIVKHGLFFAPDLSTSNRATIGGMINTDASGQGSCIYGKTRDHVISLHTVLIDGNEWTSSELTEEQLTAVCDRQDRIGAIHRIANDIEKQNRDLIADYFPPLNRSLTGYDLAHLRTNDNCFDLNSLICGSEGSLGFVTEAVVNLEPLPSCKALVMIRYSDFIAALRDARHLMQFQPTAIETIDNQVVRLAQSDSVWSKVAKFIPESERDTLAAINLVELSADDAEQIKTQMQLIIDSYAQRQANGECDSNFLGCAATDDPKHIEQLWAMRKRAVGLLGNMQDDARPVPFVEDVAVPPDNLADFIAQFRQILESHKLQYGMFGHVDAGVIHVRPALNLRDENTLRTVRDITEKVVALTRRFGGVLWGEHGKGIRSEFSPQYFGDLYPQLQRIKAAFDPDNKLNPGKIATPTEMQALLKIDEVSTRGERDRLIATELWPQYGDALYCNGNGACFNWDPDALMCPSYKVYRDRRFSPKGRAALLKEWLTRESLAGRIHQRPGIKINDGEYSSKPSADDVEFSIRVREAMDTCLACKACVSQCPIHVDVPEFRSAFYHHFFRRRRRPLRHYLIAHLENLLPWLARLPAIYNTLTQESAATKIIAKITGLTAMPRMAATPLRRRLRALDIPLANPQNLANLSPQEKQNSVIIVQDVFTSHFEVGLISECLELIKTLGFKPLVAAFVANGKPSHVLGFLSRFQRIAKKNAEYLRELADTGIPLVGLEPSMTLCYRNEYKRFVDQNREPKVRLVNEWLAQHVERLESKRSHFNAARFTLFPHCTETSTADHSLLQWQQLFAALGQTLSIEPVGCCGMAGTYGHELEHQHSSRRLFEMSWRPSLERLQTEPLEQSLATGFSCRQQCERFANKTLLHPLQALLKQVRPTVAR